MSAEDGAVDALLCRDELSVDVAFVVFDAPLPLPRLALETIKGVRDQETG